MKDSRLWHFRINFETRKIENVSGILENGKPEKPKPKFITSQLLEIFFFFAGNLTVLFILNQKTIEFQKRDKRIVTGSVDVPREFKGRSFHKQQWRVQLRSCSLGNGDSRFTTLSSNLTEWKILKSKFIFLFPPPGSFKWSSFALCYRWRSNGTAWKLSWQALWTDATVLAAQTKCPTLIHGNHRNAPRWYQPKFQKHQLLLLERRPRLLRPTKTRRIR